MAELIVVGFRKDRFRAADALNMLKNMKSSRTVDLQDAVAVYRDHDGKLRLDQSYHVSTGAGARWSGLLGGLIGALARPFTRDAIGDARSWQGDENGVADKFLRQVRTMLQPRDSMLVVVARTIDADAVAAASRRFGGRVLRTMLTVKQRGNVEAILQAVG